MTTSDATYPKVRSPRVQVEEALYAMIKSLKTGDRLPPEPALAKQLGVSRPTLREVMRTLVERGVLVRRHGVGTFVASRFPVLESGMEVLESLARLAKRTGLATNVAYLKVKERLATPIEVAGLEFPQGSELPVLIINRVIAVQDEPVADLRDIVPLDYLRAADLGENFRGSVLDIFLERGEPLLCTSRTEIIAEAANAKFAKRLGVRKGSALLKLVGQLYSYDEKVVDYSVSYFVPGHFKFHVMRKVNRK
ncbi:MAG: GntR family transcriptional regulator [Anaerolineae bacterium]|nr:GntR family transcriptional regulator [Anaerolineae bacterium]